MKPKMQFDPERDLLLERVVPIRRELVWRAWTEPQHVMQWFTPRPWSTVACRLDLQPGGEFYTRMQSPEGQGFDNYGCFLEVIPQTRLIWTDALTQGYRPSETGFGPEEKGFFTGILTLEDHPQGTLYRAQVMHKNALYRKTHEDMGFHQGWGKALDQLVAYMQSLG